MKHTIRLVGRLVCLAALAWLLGAPAARAEIIHPSDARGIRRLPGQEPVLLNFLAISRLPEDRTVLEFDVSQLPGTIGQATLDLDLQNIDAGGPAGVIDVFAFAGMGTVTPDLFDAPATFLTSFSSNQSGLFRVDVTTAVQSAIDARQQFLGFRLSTATGDRYFLGPIAGRPEPTLTVVPEPSGLAMMSAGLLGLLGYRWRSRWRRSPG